MNKDINQDHLTPEQIEVLFNKGTEPAFTGKYYQHHENGMYTCAGCGNELFSSTDKYDSGCGWPSFDRAKDNGAITTTDDNSFGMHRTEVTCGKCGGHLGHVFDDGPKETTGKRFCINSLSLDFKKKNE